MRVVRGEANPERRPGSALGVRGHQMHAMNNLSVRPLIIVRLLCGMLLAVQAVGCRALASSTATNVVLFLGDGVGIPTLNAASLFAHNRPRALFVQQAAHIALSETSSGDHWVTDSAAGMTAIVTGHKTDNGFLSLKPADAAGGRATVLKTILEHAEERGLSTGIVTNDGFIASATSAALFAHVEHRHKFADIYDQFLAPRFGDGVDLAIVRRPTSSENSMTPDQARQLTQRGYAVLEGLTALDELPADRPPRAMVFLPHDDDFDLSLATRRAITLLRRNPRGFFLMVESDAHSENVPEVLTRTVELDHVIRETVDREARDTLVLFTADHSFDLRIPQGAIGSDILATIEVRPFHTAEEVLVAAEGPGAERVRGIMKNTELFNVMMAAYGWAE